MPVRLLGSTPILALKSNVYRPASAGRRNPLRAGCLDDLLIRQRRRPLGVGVALGVLITVEFFVSSEILLISVIAGLVALA